MSNRKKPPQKASKTGYVIGRASFAKISSVEGIHLSAPMVARAKTSTAKGLTAEETRELIIRAHRKR
jgi:hypothetical protein